MDWYYIANNKQVGPIPIDHFHSLVQQNVIQSSTPVWQEGMAEWKPYLAVATTLPYSRKPGEAPPLAPATCTQCGRRFSAKDMVPIRRDWICGLCKSSFLQKLLEGTDPVTRMMFGGFWARFAAVLIDGIMLGIVNGVIQFFLILVFMRFGEQFLFLAYVILGVVQLASKALYEIFMVGRYGATLGKMVCRVKVVTAEGGPLSYGHSAARHFSKYVSALTLYIGFIMAAFDNEKRALHDYMCTTRIIRT